MRPEIVSAQVRLSGKGFRATLSTGTIIDRETLVELAAALHSAGVPADAVSCGDWRGGPQILLSGQQIALKVELRRLEKNVPER